MKSVMDRLLASTLGLEDYLISLDRTQWLMFLADTRYGETSGIPVRADFFKPLKRRGE